MRQPAWGLYRQALLVASVRAESAYVARDMFIAHKLWRAGDTVKRVELTLAGTFRER